MQTKVTHRWVVSSSILSAVLSAQVLAQTTLQTTTGASAGDQLGDSVAVVGDIDMDGQADIAVGAPYADGNGTSSGAVRVISGATGQILFTFHGAAAGDRLGESVARAGDVDGDGYGDVIAGAPLADFGGKLNCGMARVFSGRTGAVLHTWYGDEANDWFGQSVDGAGDVTGDGRADLIVGAPYGKASVTSNVGEARLFNGVTGAVIRTHNAPQGVAVFGYSVSGAGDINQDGWDDVIVGAPQSSYVGQDSGRAWVFSGKTGATLRTFDGTTSGEYFGVCVDGGGDVDNDGYPDVVIGSPFADYNGGNSGSVFVYSGRTWGLLYNFKGTASADELGRSCAWAGDVDGDGWADVVGGAKYKDQTVGNGGMARVWSGRTGAALFSVYGSVVDEQLGHAVAGGGDVNGDGLDDFVVGWPTFDVGSSFDLGRARAWSGTPLPITSYCTAATNSAGCQATISTTGSPSVSSSAAFTIRATNVVNQKPGFLFYGRHGGTLPYWNGFLCVEAPIVRLPTQNSGGNSSGTSCTGQLSSDFNGWIDLQVDPLLGAGDTLYCQFFYRDGALSALSNAVYFTVQP
ncbi:MAG: FG-GAP repeat protein [Planctomycetes bacterium]|nr:FG-GAP repeat protein [Planctomycetota bacterium]